MTTASVKVAAAVAAGMLLTIAIALPASAAEPTVAVWVETPGTMILPDRPEGKTKEIVLHGARNEYVSAQIALRTAADADKPFSFDWTALKGTGEGTIAKDKIVLFRAADIDVTKGSNENKCKDALRARPLGKFPDALVPLVTHDGTNVANSIKPEKDKTIPFWVDVFIPAGTPAGQYTGSITLKGEGAAVTMPVKLKVANVEIPAEASIPSMYNLRLDCKNATANVENYIATALAHRLQPSQYHGSDGSMPQALIDKFNPDGKGFFSMYVSDTKALPPEKLDYLKKLTAHLKERKLFEHSYLQLKDEARKDSFDGMVAVVKQIQDAMPEWKGKVLATFSSQGGTELDGLIGTQVTTLRGYGNWSWTKYDGREEWVKRRANGQHLWFYVSNNQGTPYPTFDIDTPTVAFEPRVMAWAWWYEKAEGHLYWDLMFKPSWKLDPKFPPGDGQLMYPGDFTMDGAPSWVLVKEIKEPIVSRRMKIFRQGLQEWEMLKLAEKKLGYDKVQPVMADIYTCMGTKDATLPKPVWSYEEGDWDKAREKVIQLLESK